MVLILDTYFTHRSRTTEGKDGNPLNEVRVLCNSILENKRVLRADKSIKLKPETSVLKLPPGSVRGLSLINANRGGRFLQADFTGLIPPSKPDSLRLADNTSIIRTNECQRGLRMYEPHVAVTRYEARRC
jgi:hypothetical protein